MGNSKFLQHFGGELFENEFYGSQHAEKKVKLF
jgi:hypothetical protein